MRTSETTPVLVGVAQVEQYVDDPAVAEELRMRHRAEASRGIVNPVQMYPIFENAIRHARGEGLDAHLERISRLWAGFSLVAAGNPHAWMREPKGAVEIRTPGPGNRPVSVPYLKLMNSNEKVDQGAALILTSTEVARRLGIPPSKWIFPWVSTEAHDTHAVSHRDNLHTSPGLRIAGNRCIEMAGLDVDDIQHMDIYSCFPSAVQVATAELGIDEERPLTVTGGMAFAGGPLNNYAMHGIARMTEVLRGNPGEVGLVTGNGGFLTKHAFCLFASEPPAWAFRHETPQDRVDAMPTRELAESAEGPVEIESYTVMFGRGESDLGLAACRLPDGRRAWANTRDAEVLGAMATEEFCGRQARIDTDGTVVF